LRSVIGVNKAGTDDDAATALLSGNESSCMHSTSKESCVKSKRPALPISVALKNQERALPRSPKIGEGRATEQLLVKILRIDVASRELAGGETEPIARIEENSSAQSGGDIPVQEAALEVS